MSELIRWKVQFCTSLTLRSPWVMTQLRTVPMPPSSEARSLCARKIARSIVTSLVRVKVSLIGSATYDTRQERFVQFEVGATGTRWGATRYNARSDDRKASPIGYALVLAAKGDIVEPAFWWAYWR